MKTLFLFLPGLFLAALAFAQTPEVVPFGTVVRIASQSLGEERVLNILLPPGYAEDTAHLPVLYLLDGSAHEDYPHLAGLTQFLTMYELMPRSIVVGIANVDRYRDFTAPSAVADDKKRLPTSGGSAAFLDFLEKEVQPYIRSHYRTNGQEGIVGQSLGGLLAMEALLTRRSLFDEYFIISPSVWWNGGALLASAKETLRAQPLANTRVYVAVGKEGRVMQHGARKLARLARQNRDSSSWVRFRYFPHESHATALHRSLYDALETLHRKK